MFDTIILLTGPVEQTALGAALRGHRPSLTMIYPASLAELLAIADTTLRRARLIAFASPVIVPPSVLERLGFGACNFHPGPPEFPGFSPAQFAIYHDARTFGATAHVMAERVDEGAIFDVARFDVPENTSVADLELLGYRELAALFWRNAAVLAINEALPAPIAVAWSGEKSSRRKYRALCTLPPDVGAAELERRLRAFGGGYFGMPLTVMLHGRHFTYAPPEPRDDAVKQQAPEPRISLPAAE